MNRTMTATALAAALLLGGCANPNWQRDAYNGLRVGGKMAAARPQPYSIPEPTMPPFARYQQERERMQHSPE